MDNEREQTAGARQGTMDAAMYFRKPGRFYSIEEVFGTVLAHLDADVVRARRVTAPAAGTRPDKVLRNILWARGQQGTVNHVTGDIHYVVLGLDPRRTVLTVHDTRVIEGQATLRRLLLREFWFRRPVRRAALVTTISGETRRRLLEHVRVAPEKIRVVPNCVGEHYEWCPRPFCSACPQVLLVGTTENKNLLRVADALEGLQCKVKILGCPTAEQKRVFETRGVELSWTAGLSRTDVAFLYQESDVVCFASTYEGFGMPIIEANAVGRPVLTSNCSSMPEVAGDAALLVDPFDVGSIRAGMQRLLGCPAVREDLVARGRRNAERFRPAAVARQYAELYQEVAREASRT